MTSPRRLTLLTLLATVVTTCARADEPGMFTGPTEIAEIRSRIDAGVSLGIGLRGTLYRRTAALRMDHARRGRFPTTAPIGHAVDGGPAHPDRLPVSATSFVTSALRSRAKSSSLRRRWSSCPPG